MINLIKNELIKLFKKKIIYITFAIVLAFVILSNIMYKINKSYYNVPLEEHLKDYEEQIKHLDKESEEDKDIYIEFQTEIESIKLALKYGNTGTWQNYIINDKLIDTLRTIVKYEISNKTESEEYNEAKQYYNEVVSKMDEGDWKHFAREELKEIEEYIEEAEKTKQNTIGKTEIANIEEEIYGYNLKKQIVNWRLEKEIPYGYDYKNQAINTYYRESTRVYSYGKQNKEIKNPDEYMEKQEYYNSLQKAAIAKYDIENNKTAGQTNDARGMLMEFFSEYETFIVVIIVMIAGAMISEEMSKGTIKLLLVKPYKRSTILFAKFITCIIMLIFTIIVIIAMQFIVGGIVQGFGSLETPAVVYDYNTNSLQEMNIILYMGIMALGKLPIYILLMTLAFAISTLFGNTALAITITLLGYMGSSLVNTVAISLNVELLKFFVTPNWDLTQYFWGGIPEFMHVNLVLSVCVIIAYMLIMMIPTWIVFNKRNIKNV